MDLLIILIDDGTALLVEAICLHGLAQRPVNAVTVHFPVGRDRPRTLIHPIDIRLRLRQRRAHLERLLEPVPRQPDKQRLLPVINMIQVTHHLAVIRVVAVRHRELPVMPIVGEAYCK